MSEDYVQPICALGLKRSGLYYEGFVDYLEGTLESHQHDTVQPICALGLKRSGLHYEGFVDYLEGMLESHHRIGPGRYC